MWVGPTAPILGNYPRDGIITKHTSHSFVSLAVRGAIKHGFPSGLLKAWRVGSVWKEGVATWEKKNHGFLVKAALLQAHAIFMHISEDQWDLTDLPPLYQAKAGIERTVGIASFYGLSWHSAICTDSRHEPHTIWRCSFNLGSYLAWRYYLKCFFFFFQTIPEEANFPVLFSDRGDGS